MAIFFTPAINGPEVDIKAARQAQGDVGHLGDHHMGSVVWRRTGETFENLSLSPSVDASAFGHWHGFITNGETR